MKTPTFTPFRECLARLREETQGMTVAEEMRGGRSYSFAFYEKGAYCIVPCLW